MAISSEKLKQLWADPEHRAKRSASISKARKGQPSNRKGKICPAPWMKGHPYWGRKSYVMSEETKRRISEAKKGKPLSQNTWNGFVVWARKGKTRNFNTSIERKVQRALSDINTKFISQFKCGKYIYDICLPTSNVLIECDGMYWHSRPEVQLHDKEKDVNALLHGWAVLHLPESKIDSGEFMTILSEVLGM